MAGQNLLSSTFSSSRVSSPLLEPLDIRADLTQSKISQETAAERSFLLPDRRSRLRILIVIGSGSQTKLEMTMIEEISQTDVVELGISANCPGPVKSEANTDPFLFEATFSGIPLAANTPSLLSIFMSKPKPHKSQCTVSAVKTEPESKQ